MNIYNNLIPIKKKKIDMKKEKWLWFDTYIL